MLYLSGAIAIEGKDGGADVNLAEIMGGGAPISSKEQSEPQEEESHRI